jgi:hypothetical protein
MKAFYDICFTTNEQYQFLHVQYGDIYIENTYAPLFKNWISYQRHITSVFLLQKKIQAVSLCGMETLSPTKEWMRPIKAFIIF